MMCQSDELRALAANDSAWAETCLAAFRATPALGSPPEALLRLKALADAVGETLPSLGESMDVEDLEEQLNELESHLTKINASIMPTFDGLISLQERLDEIVVRMRGLIPPAFWPKRTAGTTSEPASMHDLDGVSATEPGQGPQLAPTETQAIELVSTLSTNNVEISVEVAAEPRESKLLKVADWIPDLVAVTAKVREAEAKVPQNKRSEATEAQMMEWIAAFKAEKGQHEVTDPLHPFRAFVVKRLTEAKAAKATK
jgi:hypothetical protein